MAEDRVQIIDIRKTTHLDLDGINTKLITQINFNFNRIEKKPIIKYDFNYETYIENLKKKIINQYLKIANLNQDQNNSTNITKIVTSSDLLKRNINEFQKTAIQNIQVIIEEQNRINEEIRKQKDEQQRKQEEQQRKIDETKKLDFFIKSSISNINDTFNHIKQNIKIQNQTSEETKNDMFSNYVVKIFNDIDKHIRTIKNTNNIIQTSVKHLQHVNDEVSNIKNKNDLQISTENKIDDFAKVSIHNINHIQDEVKINGDLSKFIHHSIHNFVNVNNSITYIQNHTTNKTNTINVIDNVIQTSILEMDKILKTQKQKETEIFIDRFNNVAIKTNENVQKDIDEKIKIAKMDQKTRETNENIDDFEKVAVKNTKDVFNEIDTIQTIDRFNKVAIKANENVQTRIKDIKNQNDIHFKTNENIDNFEKVAIKNTKDVFNEIDTIQTIDRFNKVAIKTNQDVENGKIITSNATTFVDGVQNVVIKNEVEKKKLDTENKKLDDFNKVAIKTIQDTEKDILHNNLQKKMDSNIDNFNMVAIKNISSIKPNPVEIYTNNFINVANSCFYNIKKDILSNYAKQQLMDNIHLFEKFAINTMSRLIDLTDEKDKIKNNIIQIVTILEFSTWYSRVASYANFFLIPWGLNQLSGQKLKSELNKTKEDFQKELKKIIQDKNQDKKIVNINFKEIYEYIKFLYNKKQIVTYIKYMFSTGISKKSYDTKDIYNKITFNDTNINKNELLDLSSKLENLFVEVKNYYGKYFYLPINAVENTKQISDMYKQNSVYINDAEIDNVYNSIQTNTTDEKYKQSNLYYLPILKGRGGGSVEEIKGGNPSQSNLEKILVKAVDMKNTGFKEKYDEMNKYFKNFLIIENYLQQSGVSIETLLQSKYHKIYGEDFYRLNDTTILSNDISKKIKSKVNSIMDKNYFDINHVKYDLPKKLEYNELKTENYINLTIKRMEEYSNELAFISKDVRRESIDKYIKIKPAKEKAKKEAAEKAKKEAEEAAEKAKQEADEKAKQEAEEKEKAEKSKQETEKQLKEEAIKSNGINIDNFINTAFFEFNDYNKKVYNINKFIKTAISVFKSVVSKDEDKSKLKISEEPKNTLVTIQNKTFKGDTLEAELPKIYIVKDEKDGLKIQKGT